MLNSPWLRRISNNILSFGFLYFLVFSQGCKNYHRNNRLPEITNGDIQKGESLSIIYCQGCHSLPDPSLLDSKHWEESALPYMGPRLGIFKHNFERYPSNRNDKSLSKDFYPSQPLLSSEDWQYLMDYYIATSPDSLPAQQRKTAIKNGLPLFEVQTPQIKYYGPATCLVQIDTSGRRHSILLGDASRKEIFRFNASLQKEDSVHVSGPVVGLDFQNGSMTACDIGVLNPNNGKFGKGLTISVGADNKMNVDSIPLFDSLARPVQLTAVDLNNDGAKDFLACEFGYLTGCLSWYENKGGGRFQRHVIRPIPGAIKAYVQDYNHDGLPDLWVLFAQGDEGIFLFTNQGNGKFSERKVLGFPPIYGSSYFELDDFNHDGFPDILYTCGDNADYSQVLKPYHGVYIFLNDGHNNFSQKYFFPINGCYKAMARDFDGDGDLDIATISYFPDFANQPEEGFVYLENKGNFEFKPLTLPEGKLGRWLTMDVGDLDGDGKIDIILGNFSIGPSFIKSAIQWKEGPPFLFLKNIGK
jgi:FG-GAP-like repeat